MSILLEKHTVTPEEYLESEKRKSKEEGKSEYFDGEIFDMPLASYAHELIAGNLFGFLWSLLRQQGFSVFKSDLRVKLSQRRYALPDILVVKGKPAFFEKEFYNLTNPHLIIEVLSTSTERKDRGIKFKAYRNHESLQEYVLVSQYDYCVEIFYRDDAGNWLVGDFLSKPEEVVEFKSVPLKLKLKEIYEGVEFEEKK